MAARKTTHPTKRHARIALSKLAGNGSTKLTSGFTKMNRQVGQMYSKTVRKIKRKPVVSLGLAAVALGTISGLAAWYRTKKAHEKHFFFLGRK